MEITILSAIIGALTIIEYTLPLRETKPNIGNAFGAAVGIFVILDGVLYNKVNHMAAIIINGVFLIGIILFTAVMIYVVGGAKMTAKSESTLIVLGCRVKWDKPSLALVERCRAAAKYMKKNESAVAILSGGQGADENISEAECMYDLMQSFGVDKNRLFIENESTSTKQYRNCNIGISYKACADDMQTPRIERKGSAVKNGRLHQTAVLRKRSFRRACNVAES